MINTENIEKGLIIHSSCKAFPRILDVFPRNASQKVDVLLTENHNDYCVPQTMHKIVLPTTMFTLNKVSEKCLEELKDEKYDAVFLLFNEFDLTHYKNIVNFGRAIKCKKVFAFTAEKKFYSLDTPLLLVRFIHTYLKKCVTVMGDSISITLVCLYYFLVYTPFRSIRLIRNNRS